MLVSTVLAVALSVPACVEAVPSATLETPRLSGALGLVVPDAGPTTSERRARASLVRGEVVNSLRDELPSGRPLIALCSASDWVVGIPQGGEQSNDRRYAIAVRGPSGVLTSDSTRIPGLVSIADVARGRVRVEAQDDPIGYLRALDERIRDNGAARLPATILVAIVVVALALVRPPAAVSALATAALANVVLGVLDVADPWVTIPLLFLGALAGLAVPPTATLLAGTIAVYLLAMTADQTWIALSPFGPTQNSRFYGVSNLLGTILLPISLAAAWRAGARWLAPVGALAVVTVAGSRFGADAGGAVVLIAGFAALGLALLRRREALFAAGVLAAVTTLAIVVGPATHLTGADVPEAVASRVELAWLRATDGWGVGLVTAASLAVLAVLVARGPRHPLPLALAAAIAVSMVLNDSPQDVATGGLVGYIALDGWARRPGDRPRSATRPGLARRPRRQAAQQRLRDPR